MSFNSSTLDISASITLGSSVLSTLGGLGIIWSYTAIPSTQNQVRTMLIWLTLADIFQSFGYGVGSIRWFVYKNFTDTAGFNDLCVAQSFVTTLSSISSFLWTIIIVGYLFCCVYMRLNLLKSWTIKLLLFHLIAWGIPGIVTVIALSKNVLGSNKFQLNGAWCWLNVPKETQLAWGLVAGKGWEVMTYILTLTLYVAMKAKTYSDNKRYGRKIGWHEIRRGLRREDEFFCYTWLVLYCLRFWGTLRFILDTIDQEDGTAGRIDEGNVELFLLYMQSYGDGAQAFWNFILFCVCDSTVRDYIFQRQILHSSTQLVSSSDEISNPEESVRLLNRQTSSAQRFVNTL